MQVKIGKWTLYNGSWKRILYILCFCFLCIIDQRVMTCDPNGGGREIFRDLTGIVMALIIFSHYKREDIVKYKKFYLAWTILAGIGLPVLFAVEKSKMPFLIDWMIILFDMFIWGYVIITTFSRFMIEKKRPQLRMKIMAVWLLMMFLMMFSRSDLWWPVCYFIMFGCLYLTDFDETEREDLLQGALSGIILAFFIFQGHCFLYRPYDQVRYVGWYTNCNNNALYYLSVLAAVLVKLYCAVQRRSSKWLRIYYFLGVGVVLSFIFMTIGRAAWIASFAMIVFTVYILCRKKGGKAYLKSGMILALCVCFTFPLCFAAVRYIPPLRHHPIWFDGEWNEWKIHSWDPWNSEKYVDIDEILGAAGGRVADSIYVLFNHLISDSNVQVVKEMEEMEEIEEGQPLIADDEPWDAFTVRENIYKHFWSELNWRGHKKEEIGVQLMAYYWVGHAHNIFLQFGTNFGIPVMILFAIMVVWPLIFCVKQWRVTENAEFTESVLWMFIPLLFGMFEFCWGAGSLTIFMIFFSWRNVLWGNSLEKDCSVQSPAYT